jgi:hypothetical protein
VFSALGELCWYLSGSGRTADVAYMLQELTGSTTSSKNTTATTSANTSTPANSPPDTPHSKRAAPMSQPSGRLPGLMATKMRIESIFDRV